MTTAVLVDDEQNLLDYLADKLKEAWPELDIVGTAQNGRQAIALCAEESPDVVFLDIHMPGLNGIAVADALSPDTRIVFVTAFDQYALAAFEQAAVDYLLKPVTSARLIETVRRLQSAERQDHSVLRALIKELKPDTAPRHYLQWLRAGLSDTTELVSVSDVVYFQADQKYTTVVCADREHLIRTSIKELADELDPNVFWQVHRGIIVRVDQVLTATRDIRGRYTLALRERAERLRTSQTYGYRFKQM